MSSRTRIKRRDKEDAMDQLHVSIPLHLKALIPDGVNVSQEVTDYFRYKYGTTLKQREEINLMVEKTENAILQLEAKLLVFKKKLIELDQESARVEKEKREIGLRNKYAHFMVFKLLLQGSLLNKTEAIEVAYGVKVQKKVGPWSELIWRDIFTYRAPRWTGDEAYSPDPENREPYVRELLAHFYEILPAIEYTGSGKDEKRAFQNYLDLLSGTLRLCGRGHTYDALSEYCEDCGSKKEGIYFKLEDGEIRDYLSETRIHRAYKEYEKKRSNSQIEGKGGTMISDGRGENAEIRFRRPEDEGAAATDLGEGGIRDKGG